MRNTHPLPSGTRIKVRGTPSGLILRSFTGRIVGRNHLDGFYIVRLDEPAIYYDNPGEEEDLWEIREADVNLDVV